LCRGEQRRGGGEVVKFEASNEGGFLLVKLGCSIQTSTLGVWWKEKEKGKEWI